MSVLVNSYYLWNTQKFSEACVQLPYASGSGVYSLVFVGLYSKELGYYVLLT